MKLEDLQPTSTSAAPSASARSARPRRSAYNALVQSFPEVVRLAREGGTPKTEQTALFEDGE